eukprot:9093870-Pyramimonas_sp.AAC.1
MARSPQGPWTSKPNKRAKSAGARLGSLQPGGPHREGPSGPQARSPACPEARGCPSHGRSG